MHDRSTKAVLFLAGIVLALGLAALAWTVGGYSSEAQQNGMHNCPQAGRWAISVWGGADGTDTGEALATCGEDAVSAAYYLDPQTGGWLRWFSGRPDISNLTTLNALQGIIALGSPSATPAATTAAPAGQGSIQSCALAGRWAISVWSGQDGVGADQALASCGSGAVSAAYYLDSQTGSWLRWFPERPEISNLTTLNNLQGVIALGSTGFSLAVDKFGDGTITSSPGGIDCGSDCTNQAATFPSGTSVVLTPTADAGSTFSHWSGCDSVSGDSCTLQVDRDKTVFATFAFSEVKIPETTKVLDAATMGYLIRQEGSTYYFGPQAAAVAALQPGDVIVSAVGEGFIRKVTAVNATAEEIAVATTDATLEDAIEQGTIILHQRLTPADVQSAQVLAPGASTSADMTVASLMDFNVDIDAELMPGVKAYGSASLSADLDMAVSFDGWDWGCGCFPVREAKAVLTTQNVDELGLLAEAKFSFSKEKEIASYTFAPIWVTVGPVPVGFFPELSVAVGVEGHAGAKMESKVTLENTYAVGVHYRRGSGWSPVNDYSRDFDFTPPTLTAEAEAKAYVAPQLSVKVYGLVGPYFGLQGFLRLSAQPLQTPWWSLYGGIGASAGFEAEALGVGLGNYSWPIWNKEWLLAQAQPEGTSEERVAFVSDREGNWDWEIYVMNADGTGLTNLTDNPALDFNPVWSPDRTKIAFERFESCDDPDLNTIYIASADGSDERRLTEGWSHLPAWSPDGKRIAFAGNGDLYVINVDGNGQRRLTSGGGLHDYPSWSPDGARIAFVRDGEIYVANAYEGGQEKLTRSPGVYAGDPAWSPDGTKIAFNGWSSGFLSGVYVMNPDGTGQRKLADGPFLAWSPDGAKIAYIMGGDLYVMGSDGSGQRRLVKDASAVYPRGVDPVWATDGSDIFFASRRDGNLEIYVTDIGGSHLANLTKDPAADGLTPAFGCE
jgi:Tol biopolymer transport system component